MNHKSDFHFELDESLIARRPLPERSQSRLLHVDTQGCCHDRQFAQLGQLLRAGDLLVFNDTRVVPARLHGRKATGGKVEILAERWEADLLVAQLRVSKKPGSGARLTLEGGGTAIVEGRDQAFFRLRLEDGQGQWLDYLQQHGHMPLPPYIDRPDEQADRDRYQTVYARQPGAVAAPTAGLHFDAAQLEALKNAGIDMTWLTLHVGAGTFSPVREDDLSLHRMHSERAVVSPDNVAAVQAARDSGGRVICVGTTTVRALESAARDGSLQPYADDTDIFIRPGYQFRCLDALITNFHLPQSTLLMLVCAFAGYQPMMAAYRHAVSERYRFFSYGDAMFIEKPE